MGIIDEIKEAVSTKGISSRASEIKEVFTGSGDYREIKPNEIKDSHDKEEVLDEPERKDYDRSLKAKIKSKAREKVSNIKKSVVSAYSRPFDTSSEREQRVKDEDVARINKATFGMGKTEKAAYETTHYTQKSARAIEKAKKDIPIGETADEKRDRLQKKRERKEEVAHAYQKSKASSAGTEAGKAGSGSGIFGLTRQEDREVENPIKAGMRPVGFESPSPGSVAPGFERPQFGSAPGFGSPNRMRPVGFEAPSGQAPIGFGSPQLPPAPVERRMTRGEQHRANVDNETQRWKQNQMQQYQQQQGLPSFLLPPTQPSSNGRGRNQAQQPRYVNLFERQDTPNPTNNSNGKKTSSKGFYNPFEHAITPMHDSKSNSHSELANASASLLGIGGTNNSKGNKKSKWTKALWEL